MILKRFIVAILYSFILLEIIIVIWSNFGDIVHPVPTYFWINLKDTIHDSGFPYFSIIYFIFIVLPYELLVIQRPDLFKGLRRKLQLFIGLEIFWTVIAGSFIVNLFIPAPWYANFKILLLLIILAIPFVVIQYFTIDKKHEAALEGKRK